MSVASDVRRTVLELPPGGFLHLRELPGWSVSPAAATSALRRVRESEHVVPVGRGVYYKARPTRFGLTRPDPLRLGYEFAKAAGYTAGVGPCGYTAARALGLTTQVPSRDSLSVAGRAPAPLRDVIFEARSPQAGPGLRPLEVAVLELLGAWPRYVETSWASFSASVARLSDEGLVDVEAVVGATASGSHATARARAQLL